MILALANIILVVDLVVIGPGTDLLLWRSGLSLVGMVVLLYGLIFKSS